VPSPGVYKCPTPCDPGCEDSCHERHKPHLHRLHDPQDCDQLQLGRDITPMAPPEFARSGPQPPPVKATRAAYARALRADDVTWWRRQVLRLRGPQP
jgi:hypothetical protein